MKLETLADVLHSANLGTIGTDIFVHRMDADVAKGILLRNPLDGVPVDQDLPGYYRHYVQVIIRASDQAEGDALMESVKTALTIKNREFRDGSNNLVMKINHLYPRTLPRIYPVLESDSIEWSIDFDSCYVMP